MKTTMKTAGFGLLTGTALLLATMPALARGPQGPEGFSAERGGLFGSAFAELDADGNGLITEEDLQAQAEARLAEADADGNGSLSLEELTAQVEAHIAERSQNAAPDGRKGDPAQFAAQRVQKMLEARDTDKDGELSAAEMGPENGFGRIIDRFDTDDDNAISQAEYDEAKAALESRMARNDERGGRGPGGHRGPGAPGQGNDQGCR